MFVLSSNWEPDSPPYRGHVSTPPATFELGNLLAKLPSPPRSRTRPFNKQVLDFLYIEAMQGYDSESHGSARRWLRLVNLKTLSCPSDQHWPCACNFPQNGWNFFLSLFKLPLGGGPLFFPWSSWPIWLYGGGPPFFFYHGFVHFYKTDECGPVGHIKHTTTPMHVYPTQPEEEGPVVDS